MFDGLDPLAMLEKWAIAQGLDSVDFDPWKFQDWLKSRGCQLEDASEFEHYYYKCKYGHVFYVIKPLKRAKYWKVNRVHVLSFQCRWRGHLYNGRWRINYWKEIVA